MTTATVAAARQMRKALTPPEARLWVRLRALRKNGYAFRRQEPFRGYFLDFACLSRRLAVEVDGRRHDSADAIRHDRRRDAVLAGEGFLTLRFRAEEVRTNLDHVMRRILEEVSRRPRRWEFQADR
jgi:very-short-patch-repair endonuclease